MPKAALARPLPTRQTRQKGRLNFLYPREQGFAEDGYRIVMNCNRDGGQTVYQIHLHLLAGAPLGRFGTPT